LWCAQISEICGSSAAALDGLVSSKTIYEHEQRYCRSKRRPTTVKQSARPINALFGLDVEQMLAYHQEGNRIECLRDIYRAQLKSIGGFPYVPWFAMKNQTGNIVYYLLHGTRNVRGVEKMKDAMWKMAPSGTIRSQTGLQDLMCYFSRSQISRHCVRHYEAGVAEGRLAIKITWPSLFVQVTISPDHR
jgi:hypothetical protein